MRRVAPSLPISPKLLKHFAAATVALTACLAIFADGSASEAVAEQVKANEAKQAEVDMMGSRRLAGNSLKIKAVGGDVPVGGESSLGDGGSSSIADWSDSGMDRNYGYAVAAPHERPARRFEGQTVSLKAVPTDALPTQTNDPKRKLPPKKGERPEVEEERRPDENQLEKLLEASRQRSQSHAPDAS
jgi:hypothetical protein